MVSNLLRPILALQGRKSSMVSNLLRPILVLQGSKRTWFQTYSGLS